MVACAPRSDRAACGFAAVATTSNVEHWATQRDGGARELGRSVSMEHAQAVEHRDVDVDVRHISAAPLGDARTHRQTAGGALQRGGAIGLARSQGETESRGGGSPVTVLGPEQGVEQGDGVVHELAQRLGPVEPAQLEDPELLPVEVDHHARAAGHVGEVVGRVADPVVEHLARSGRRPPFHHPGGVEVWVADDHVLGAQGRSQPEHGEQHLIFHEDVGREVRVEPLQALVELGDGIGGAIGDLVVGA